MNRPRPYGAIGDAIRKDNLEEKFLKIMKVVFFVAWLIFCAAVYYTAVINLDPVGADYRQPGVDRAEVVGRWAE